LLPYTNYSACPLGRRIGVAHRRRRVIATTASRIFGGESEAFRGEVCEFYQVHMAPSRTAGHGRPADRTGLDEEFERDLQRIAGGLGYIGLTAPAEIGGKGRSHRVAAAFNYETAYHDAPLIDTAWTLGGAPIVAFGSEAQKAFFVPKMLGGELEFCIAYTEPTAGNDLSPMTTTAVADGAEFVLNGHKWLLTGADKADYAMTVAITDPTVSVRKGISMFIVDTKLPGVSVVGRPTMSRYELFDVVFDNVRVGADALVGDINRGWPQMAYALEHERNGMFQLGWCQRVFDELIAYCESTERGGPALLDDPVIADQVAQLWLELQVARRFALRLVEEEEAGRRSKVGGSLAKVYTTELSQRLAQAATDIAGLYGTLDGYLFDGAAASYAPVNGRFCYEYLYRVDGPLSVGANELHRSGIAQAGIGLPRA
jgi:alkylation response protein AidB-like acyl-CoA dehydrogenase